MERAWPRIPFFFPYGELWCGYQECVDPVKEDNIQGDGGNVRWVGS